jgi:hypothetical protein
MAISEHPIQSYTCTFCCIILGERHLVINEHVAKNNDQSRKKQKQR